MTSLSIDPIGQGLVVSSMGSRQLASKQLRPQQGLPVAASVCRVGLASVGATCDMVVLYLLRRRLRGLSPPSTTTQQQEQPASVKNTAWLDQKLHAQGLVQLPPQALVTVLAAVVGLGCAAWGVRLNGAGRRRKQNLHKKIIQNEEFVPPAYAERDEPDAEPSGGNWWTSIPEKKLSDTASSRLQKVTVKSLARKHKVKSTDDEPEDEDAAGNECMASPGSHGFVGQQTADVERVLQIFRMHTEGQVHLVDEEVLEQRNRESGVVPNGLVRANTFKLESKPGEQRISAVDQRRHRTQ